MESGEQHRLTFSYLNLKEDSAMNVSTQDAIYNWLSIQVVVEKRPTDKAAKETAEFFYEILKEDYQINNIEYIVTEDKYIVNYLINGEKKSMEYPIEYMEVILNQIESNSEQFE
ncbi:MAG: hypothetical protein K0R71_2209 [Bacillales bacterium]|jgi:hypothetical protein|nr:hypothetical protein [Bacillales bacterium]